MMKYRKKPVVIEAIEWTGENREEISNFIDSGIFEEYSLLILTLEGTMVVSIGDFIIRGISGEFYSCKPDIFWKTYEKVGENV